MPQKLTKLAAKNKIKFEFKYDITYKRSLKFNNIF